VCSDDVDKSSSAPYAELKCNVINHNEKGEFYNTLLDFDEIRMKQNQDGACLKKPLRVF
jgi:hypothetical protein